MVLGQVGEERELEADRVATVQGERVRGDLHRAGTVAGVEHAPERRLQVDRLRRRALDLLLDPADNLPHGPQQPAPDARRLEDLPHKERRRRLPVGPRHPDDPQLLAGRPEEPSRHRRHRRPRVRYHDLRHTQIKLFLNHKSHRPPLNGALGKHMPIDLLPRHTEEQAPRLDPAAVVSKSLHIDGGVPNDPRPFNLRDQRCQSHGAESRKGVGYPSPKHSVRLLPSVLGRGTRRPTPPIPAARRGMATQTPRSCRTPARPPTRRRCLPAAGRPRPPRAAEGPGPGRSR